MARPPALRVLSLCAGIGGLDLGVRLALARDGRRAVTVGYVEGEIPAVAILVARMADGTLDAAPVWSDLRTFDGRAWRGAVDCVLAGFPCQDLSVAGKRAGLLAGERSALWFEVVRVLREVGAWLLFVENVPPLVRYLGHVLGPLADLGFDAEWCCARASEVGAPHKRERVFLLAHARRGASDGLQPEPVAWRNDPSATRSSREDLADGDGDGQPQPGGALEDERRWPRDGRLPLGDPDGLGQRSEHGGHDAPGWREPDGWGPELGDPARGGSCLTEIVPALARGRSRLPGFPPGPADRDAWAAVLAADPTLAPAVEPEVRGVADGAAPRVDRLRALGNAVVPAQAALAWRLLWSRLMEPR